MDRQTLMVRRSLAAGASVLVLIFLVFGVRGCLESRKESAMRDYVGDAEALVTESNQQSKVLFELLGGSEGVGEVEIANALNGYRGQAAQLVDRARALDPPGELETAQRYLVEVLDFRHDGINAIADEIPAAIAGEGQQGGAATGLAFNMRSFLASDQLYLRRFQPLTERALSDEGIPQKIEDSEFLPDVIWLQPAEVATRVTQLGGQGDGEAAPGLHGNGVGTVTLGGQTLTPGGSNSITISDDLAFEVQVANQGENTEADVKVKVTVGDRDPIELEKILDVIAAGETNTVNVPLGQRPPTGEQVPIRVEIEPVSGEEKTDNNVAEFSVIFTS